MRAIVGIFAGLALSASADAALSLHLQTHLTLFYSAGAAGSFATTLGSNPLLDMTIDLPDVGTLSGGGASAPATVHLNQFGPIDGSAFVASPSPSYTGLVIGQKTPGYPNGYLLSTEMKTDDYFFSFLIGMDFPTLQSNYTLPANPTFTNSGDSFMIALEHPGGLREFLGYKSDLTSLNFTGSGMTFTGQLPETSTWAMMVAGFGLIGGAMRRRQSARHPAISVTLY